MANLLLLRAQVQVGFKESKRLLARIRVSYDEFIKDQAIKYKLINWMTLELLVLLKHPINSNSQNLLIRIFLLGAPLSLRLLANLGIMFLQQCILLHQRFRQVILRVTLATEVQLSQIKPILQGKIWPNQRPRKGRSLLRGINLIANITLINSTACLIQIYQQLTLY